MSVKAAWLLWCQRTTLFWRWRFWHQVGSPTRTLAALDEVLWALGAPSPSEPTSGLPVASDIQEGGQQAGKGRRLLSLQATRAHVFGELGRWAEARSQLEQLVSFEPGSAAHAYNLGYVCMQLGDAASAAPAFRTCIQLAPNLDQAWYGLGNALSALGDRAGAHHAWAQQVSMQPMCADGYVQLVRLSVQREDALAARSWLNKLREFDPRQALVLEPLLASLPTVGATSDLSALQ